MTKILDYIIGLYSLEMRSTNELEKLNDIWEDFNLGKLSATEASELVKAKKWKYHQEKVDIFLNLMKLRSKEEV